MKIFYGVQGTGNGHITRARIMARELYAAEIEVSFLFSGRSSGKFFDMEIFNHYQWRQGLTFNTENSKVNYIKTVLDTHPIRFVKDINTLDIDDYDLIISDFEPVTSWAAKFKKQKTIGIGHQYAFNHSIPRTGSDPMADLVMKFFAPVDYGIGLHWHHFGQPILPPIIETPEISNKVQSNKILVYLPFESQLNVINTLSPFKDFDFHIYSPEEITSNQPHIFCHQLSREGFQKDLKSSSGIISNAGFELASESLYLGKKILAKPLSAQMEQISNAAALQQLGYGHTMNTLDTTTIEHWLHEGHAVQIRYPNVAQIIVQWIQDGMPEMDLGFTEKIWNEVQVQQINPCSNQYSAEHLTR